MRCERIPAGVFMMGSEYGQEDERPVHRVHVDAFDASVYPVTRAEYRAFLDATADALETSPPTRLTA